MNAPDSPLAGRGGEGEYPSHTLGLWRSIQSDTMVMFELKSTLVFDQWLRALRDKRGRARILIRLDAVRMGHLGDSKSVGGDKSTQVRDIEKAHVLLNTYDEG